MDFSTFGRFSYPSAAISLRKKEDAHIYLQSYHACKDATRTADSYDNRCETSAEDCCYVHRTVRKLAALKEGRYLER